MAKSSTPIAKSEESRQYFGLRIESHLLQVAVATPVGGGRYRLEIDDIKCPEAGGWLTTASAGLLGEALSTLVDRHEMRRQRVAVSLDGDFCVTRVTMGKSEDVDRELAMLADRVPRYLQLGPGAKVTGGTRQRLDGNLDYAVTGVGSRHMIQMIYDALRLIDIEIAWVEPALVSVARLVGQAKIGGDNPIMIADGTGQHWDVGICYEGRLLLDYRPAAATNEHAFRDALDGHISRLRRFCHRHCGIESGELNQLLLCGNEEKLCQAVETLGNSLEIEPALLRVPDFPDLYELDEDSREARCVPAVATVLPLLTGELAENVPDLLAEVRRAPDLPWHVQLIHTGWPAVAAAVVLFVSHLMVADERKDAQLFSHDRTQINAALEATQARFAAVSAAREQASTLELIAARIEEPAWNLLFDRVTQSLPEVCRLNEFRVEDGGRVHLDGVVLDESTVFEIVENLRHLPGIHQVALRGTSPDSANQGTRFVIHLMTRSPAPAASGTRNE